MQKIPNRIVRILVLAAAVSAAYALFLSDLNFKKEKQLNTRLSARINLLSNEQRKIKNSLKKSEVKYNALRIYVLRAQQHIAKLMKELWGANATISGLNNDVSVLRSQNALLEEKLSQIISASQKGAIEEGGSESNDVISPEEENMALEGGPDISTARQTLKEIAKSLNKKEADTTLLKVQLKKIGEQNNALIVSNESLKKRLKELEIEKPALTKNADEVNKQLSLQNELISSLRNNIQSLTDSAAQKEDKMNTLEAEIVRLNLTKNSLEESLRQKERLSKDVSLRYDNQNQKVTELANILTQKELEVFNKAKSIASLKNEIYELQAKSHSLETELNAARERQKKIIANLNELAKLSNALQSSLGETYEAPAGNGLTDKEKAEDLKRRVEIILESDEPGK